MISIVHPLSPSIQPTVSSDPPQLFSRRAGEKAEESKTSRQESEPAKKSSEYRWVVDAAGITGAIIGGALGGPVGIIIGGAIASALAVPLRRYLAERENRKALYNDMSLSAEMAVTGGASLLFGAVFMGAAGIARVAATRLAPWVVGRLAAHAGGNSLFRHVASKYWQPFRQYYVQSGHNHFRAAALVPTIYDLTHDKNGNVEWNPGKWSLDTGWGFASAIYSGNLVYSKFFGTNVFGLDIAAPMSIAAYQLFRIIAGAKPWDFSDFNYNEAIRWRYINEFGNIIQSTATYGRAYVRPDLRGQIATQRGMQASKDTGTPHVSPFGWVFDYTLGLLYRVAVPRFIKQFIQPTIHYPVGPLARLPKWMGRWGERVAERLTIITGYNKGDMMKPIYGPAGRILSLAQVWGLVVPYQFLSSAFMGMTGAQWSANRYWKMTAWSIIGNPIKSGLGGDTVIAQGSGFIVGMMMDAAITMFYNPRAAKRHWSWDLHESLVNFEKYSEGRDAIARHILRDIFCRQMTDWDLKSLVSGNGLNKFNDDYLRTFQQQVSELSGEERRALENVYAHLKVLETKGGLNSLEVKGIIKLSPILGLT